MIECPCCDGTGSHVTGYCGDGCCAYTDTCGLCHGEGEVTQARMDDVEAGTMLACDHSWGEY